MNTNSRVAITALAMLAFAAICAGRLAPKEKIQPVSPDDPTLRLFQLLDSGYAGKLADYYLLADVFKSPKNPDQEEQHVLKVEYDKERGFGRLRIYVRTVDRPSPDQLKAYTPKQIFEFAEAESEKFSKTDPGSFGKPGDVYFRPLSEAGPLASAPISDETRTHYERFVTDYIMPALQKK
jgi:hypothetical protein